MRSRLRVVPPPRFGWFVPHSQPVSRSVTYPAKLDFEYSPSLGMSMPTSACFSTAESADFFTTSMSAAGNGSPSTLRLIASSTSGGRTRLPTVVVRIRFSLRFMRYVSS